MLFSSLTFLLAFLPITVILYFSFNNRTYRNVILLITSLFFYAWGEPKTIFLMILTIIVNYFLAIQVEKNKKTYLYVSILFNIGLLFFFKYFNFFIKDVLFIKNSTINIVLPIGISFYIFQIMSYVIDVHRKKVKAQKNIIYLGAYVSMFPQLIAGPIVRYETIASELIERKETFEDFSNGLRRFITGLSKKIIIANNMAIIADKIFWDIKDLSTPIAWLGAIAYSLQIYYDFSGYSDMAIGLGKMFGFNFDENFNYPYIAKTVTDFWRRWHISLSSWFKDYVYIPLGGSRVSLKRSIINLLIVWSLTGLWHGASYNFIVWGLFYGIILILEKYILNKFLSKFPITHRILTLITIIVGWVIFNTYDLNHTLYYLSNMFVYNGTISLNMLNNLGILYLWPYFILAILGSTPIIKLLLDKLNKIGFLYDLYLLLILGICFMFLINNSYNPFIYFRF